jgi:hypothetical protein
MTSHAGCKESVAIQFEFYAKWLGVAKQGDGNVAARRDVWQDCGRDIKFFKAYCFSGTATFSAHSNSKWEIVFPHYLTPRVLGRYSQSGCRPQQAT